MPVVRKDTQDGGLTVTTITIDNPPVNVLDLDHCRELASLIREVHDDDRTRVLVLRGSGRAFSAGVDIKQHTPELMPSLLPAFHEVLHSLLSLSTVNIAAVHGTCMGGAAEIALACDRIVVEEGSRFSFPEINVGCYPPAAIPMLTHRAGHGRAVGAILSGRDLPLSDLQAWGVVDRLSETGKLDGAIEEEIALYRGKSPTVLGITARLLHEEARLAWGDRVREIEVEYLEKLLPQPDVTEGVLAFEAKRKPVWQPLGEAIDLDQIDGMAQ